VKVREPELLTEPRTEQPWYKLELIQHEVKMCHSFIKGCVQKVVQFRCQYQVVLWLLVAVPATLPKADYKWKTCLFGKAPLMGT
jgi:hypothetical protein